MKPVLLDTCALIWIAVSPERLSKKALHKIETVSSICASSVSAWEIAFKWRTGKLMLETSPEDFIERIKAAYEISLLSVDESTMLKAANLPLIHCDPADRFIIATALLNSLDVVTGDRRFAEYGVRTFS